MVDTLYDKLLIIKEKDAGGNVIERERGLFLDMRAGDQAVWSGLALATKWLPLGIGLARG